MRRRKRIAWLCAVALFVGMVPITAFADDAEVKQGMISTGLVESTSTVIADEVLSNAPQENSQGIAEIYDKPEEDNDSTKLETNAKEAETKSDVLAAEPSLNYRAHVASIGWQARVSNGAVAGTTGKNLGMQALDIKLESSIPGDIKYRAHVASIGWQDPVTNGAMAGTTGKGLSMEAVQIELSGDIALHYDIYYRVQSVGFGWLDWAKNGAKAGSTGYSRAIEAIEIKLVAKNGKAPGKIDSSYHEAMLVYRAHVSNDGWQGSVRDGMMAGTTGRGLKLEALYLRFASSSYSGAIEYQTHVQNVGWQQKVANGEMAGSVGKSQRIEAIKINLTGQVNADYDVYYRAHVQGFGWLDWAKNGQEAGSVGLSLRVEALEIQLKKKGSAAPGVITRPYIEVKIGSQAHFSKQGWNKDATGNSVSLNSNAGLPVEAYRLWIADSAVSGGIRYRSSLLNEGWQESVWDGQTSGTTGQSKKLEAFGINLTGDLTKYFDVYYQAYTDRFGWMGWVKNGQDAGTGKLNTPVEIIQVRLMPKGSEAPGSTVGAYRTSSTGDIWLDEQIAAIASTCNYDLRACFDYVSRMPYKTMSLYPEGNWAPAFAREMIEQGSGNCYRYAALFCLLAQHLGYEANVMSGWVPSYSQGGAPHGWVEIHIDGQPLICDPTMMHSLPGYNWYLTTYANAPTHYWWL